MLRRGQKRGGGGTRSSDRTEPRLLFLVGSSHMILDIWVLRGCPQVVPGNPSARAKIFDFSLIKINNASSNLGISGDSEIPIIFPNLPAGPVDFQKSPVVGLTGVGRWALIWTLES